MNLFWLEYLHFAMAMIAILVCVSAATLFFITYRTEAQLTTAWRAVGFTALAVAFFLFILERKFPGIGIFALVLEVFGFYGIFRGVSADLNLSALRNIGGRAKSKAPAKKPKTEKPRRGRGFIWNLITLIVFGIVAILLFVLYQKYLLAGLVVFSLIFILATIRLQIRRYRNESRSDETRRQNLYPLISYIFLFLAGIAFFLYRLPELDLVVLRQLELDYSAAWQVGVWFTLIGFIFLAVWAWTYIRVRMFLRTFVLFLTIGVIISSLGALVFTQLIFNVVERNNLQLMERGALSQQAILADRLDTALFVAHTIAVTPSVSENIQVGDKEGLGETTEDQLFEANVDIIRIYNPEGEVVASPGDIREVGRLFNEDEYVAFVINERSQVKTFDLEPGVITPQLVARALYPIVNEEQLVGVVEVAYRIDDAFVDSAKKFTGLDVTVYVDDVRAATTITTLDGVARWVGSKETDPMVLENTLQNGERYSTPAERLGVPYYSAYTPVRNVNGDIIGMIAVGTPTVILFEDTRQQLVSTFLIVTLISFGAAWLGYAAILNFRKQDLLRGKAN